MLREVPCQALKSRIFLVHTVPRTVLSIFEKYTNKIECIGETPPCLCDDKHRAVWEHAGRVTVHQGHFALLPVELRFADCCLRYKDPLPIRGADTRAAAITECTALAHLLQIPMSEKWDVSLLVSIFS